MNNPSFAPLVSSFTHSDSTGISNAEFLTGYNQVTFKEGTTFVYVSKGSANYLNKHIIAAGEYAAFTDGSITTTDDSEVLLIHKPDYKGVKTVGGPIEETGRLKYIDGCTDSLLIPPVKLGDPCLNHLHFPININQTMHTHPSIRLGMVTKGAGKCTTPFGDIDLLPGMVFAILPETGEYAEGLDGKQYLVGSHCFSTTSESTMDVIAYHPDSDFGPTDEEHPMLNRTIVNGVSARYIDEIRTK